MKKENLIVGVSTAVALAAAVVFFHSWHPERWLQRDMEAVTMADIEADLVTDYRGNPAGDDIPRITGADEFLDTLNDSDYFTMEPVDIVPTGVYSLKEWVDHYERRKGKRTGRRRPEVIRSQLDLQENYHPYYLLGLQDGSYILAQIPEADAWDLKHGKEVLLPVGQKVGMMEQARDWLSEICKEYGAPMDGVFYGFQNEWYEEKGTLLFLLRYGCAALLCLVLGVGMSIAGQKIFCRKE